MFENIRSLFKSKSIPVEVEEDDFIGNTTIFSIDIHDLTTKAAHKKFWNTLMHLYATCLRKDPDWHFFFEGDFNHIRCRYETMKNVCRVLKDYNFTHTDPTEWVDSNPTVRQYQQEFTKIFHCFSEIALKMEPLNTSPSNTAEERRVHLRNLLDRIQHCFLNHIVYRAQEVFETTDHRDTWYEVNLLSDTLIHRAYYIGKCRERWALSDKYYMYDKNKVDEKFKEEGD